MTYSMKLNTDVDRTNVHRALENILFYLDIELYAMLYVQAKEKMSREIVLIDDRLAEQLEQNTLFFNLNLIQIWKTISNLI